MRPLEDAHVRKGPEKSHTSRELASTLTATSERVGWAALGPTGRGNRTRLSSLPERACINTASWLDTRAIDPLRVRLKAKFQ